MLVEHRLGHAGRFRHRVHRHLVVARLAEHVGRDLEQLAAPPGRGQAGGHRPTGVPPWLGGASGGGAVAVLALGRPHRVAEHDRGGEHDRPGDERDDHDDDPHRREPARRPDDERHDRQPEAGVAGALAQLGQPGDAGPADERGVGRGRADIA